MYRKYRENTPLFGGRKEERLSKLLFQTMQGIHGDIKKMRREMLKESPKEFGSRAKSRFAHGRCEHVATHYDAQCSQMPRANMREMKEEEMPRRETLSGLLQEYKYQNEKFRDHITF